jgi:hypothetical protein
MITISPFAIPGELSKDILTDVLFVIFFAVVRMTFYVGHHGIHDLKIG